MKVRIRRRLWVALMVNWETGKTVPLNAHSKLSELKKGYHKAVWQNSGWWVCFVPFRYDELAFIKRRARRRARKQQRDFIQSVREIMQ